MKLSILDLKRALQIDNQNSEVSSLLSQFKKEYSLLKKKENEKTHKEINDNDAPTEEAKEQKQPFSIALHLQKLGYDCIFELDKLQEYI